jgi:hypothetical protein
MTRLFRAGAALLLLLALVLPVHAGKSLVTVTDTWQEASTTAVVITVQTRGSGALLFNQTADDTTAHRYHPHPGDQFWQSQDLPVYVRRDGGTGWALILDPGTP